MWHRAVRDTVCNRSLVGLRKLQICSLTTSTQTISLVKASAIFSHIIDCPPRTIFQALPALDNSVQRDSHSAGV